MNAKSKVTPCGKTFYNLEPVFDGFSLKIKPFLVNFGIKHDQNIHLKLHF